MGCGETKNIIGGPPLWSLAQKRRFSDSVESFKQTYNVWTLSRTSPVGGDPAVSSLQFALGLITIRRGGHRRRRAVCDGKKVPFQHRKDRRVTELNPMSLPQKYLGRVQPVAAFRISSPDPKMTDQLLKWPLVSRSHRPRVRRK